MGLHHLLDGFARRELFEKEFDRDARAGYDRLSHHDAGIGLNKGLCHPFTFCATWSQGLQPEAADTFPFRRPRLRRLAIASKQAQ